MSLQTSAMDAASTTPTWQLYAIAILAVIIAAFFIKYLSEWYLRGLLNSLDIPFAPTLYKELRFAIFSTVLAAGLYLATTAFDVPADIATTLLRGSITIILVVWARTGIRIGRDIFDILHERDRTYEFLPIFNHVWNGSILAITILAILSIWRIDVTPLLASAGIAGVAVGFAAKDTVANFFGAIALYMDDTYRIGDYIVLDTGQEGIVEDISIRSTVLRTLDDTLVTIPNSSLNSSIVVNESSPQETKRIQVPVGVAYESDLELVEELLVEAAESCDIIHDRPKPQARLNEFGDSSIDYTLYCWASPKRPKQAQHRVLKEIHQHFAEEDITIPFPQRDVNLSPQSTSDEE